MHFQNDGWIYLPVAKTDEVAEFVKWLQLVDRNPYKLSHICRSVVRHHISLVSGDRDVKPLLYELPIPKRIKSFLDLEAEVDALMS